MKRWLILLALLTLGCNTVSTEQIKNLKTGDTMVWRHQVDGKSWMYLTRIKKMEGDTVVYETSKKEGTSKLMNQLVDYDKHESKTKLADLEKYAAPQGPEELMIIEIRPFNS